MLSFDPYFYTTQDSRTGERECELACKSCELACKSCDLCVNFM